MLGYFLAMLDRTIPTLLIGPIQKDMHIGDTRFGLLQGSTFAIFYLLAGLPIGWLVDRTSRVRVIMSGVLLWSVMTMASGFATRFLHLFLARVGVGVGEAALNPAAYSLLADLFPKERLGRAMAIFSSGGTLGIGFAFAFGGALVSMFGTRSDISLPIVGALRIWQVAFLAVGAPGLLLAVLLQTVREPARPRTPAESADVSVATLLTFLRRRASVVLPIFGAFACQTILVYAFLTWMPALLLRVHGMSAVATGIAMGTAVGVCGLLGFFSGGALADHWLRNGHLDAHMRVGFWAMLCVLPAGLLVTLSGSSAVTVVGLCVLMFVLMSPTAAGIAGLQLITPPSLRGRLSAVFMMVVNFAGLGFGPVFVALLTDYAFKSKAAVDLSLAIVTLVVTPLAVVAFAFARRGVGTSLSS